LSVNWPDFNIVVPQKIGRLKERGRHGVRNLSIKFAVICVHGEVYRKSRLGSRWNLLSYLDRTLLL
jgi:hypothetical protein